MTLSDTALTKPGHRPRSCTGPSSSGAPRTYTRKVKGAQEAHEAHPPVGEPSQRRSPASCGATSEALYDLIWKRTVASQMTDAQQERVDPRIGAATQDGTPTEWAASSRSITFGYLRAYVEAPTTRRPSSRTASRYCPSSPPATSCPTRRSRRRVTPPSPPAATPRRRSWKRLEDSASDGRPPAPRSCRPSRTVATSGKGHRTRSRRGPAVRGREPAGAALRRPRRLQLHRPHGGRPRRDRGPPRRREPWLRRFWFGQEDNGAAGLKVMVDRGLDEIGATAINTIRSASTRPGTSSSSSRVGTGPT